MKRKFDFIIGLFALVNVIYKIVKCPNCEDRILWFEVSGIVYILFWGFLAAVLFYSVYKENWLNKEKEN